MTAQNSRNGRERRECAGETHEPQRQIAGPQPEHRGNTQPRARSEILANGPEKRAGRQDAAGSDQACDLNSERQKRNQVNSPYGAQEPPVHHVIGCRLDVLSPQQNRYAVAERPVRRDPAVQHFTNHSEAGHMMIRPQRPPALFNLRQCPENRMRGAQHFAIRQDQLHGALKTLARDFGKAVRNLLVWSVSHLLAREALPVSDPDAAEATLAIENHERCAGRRFGVHMFAVPSTIADFRGCSILYFTP